jgi:hypothetical protein
MHHHNMLYFAQLCELHGILEFIVCNIRKCNDPLIGFDMVNCPHEGE